MRFSMGAALGEAFGLMRRRPAAVLVWGLIVAGPGFAALALILPAMGDLIAHMPVDPSADDPAFDRLMMTHMVQFQLASMLGNVGQLLGMALAYAAVMRAILRPSERSFFSLRIGMDELRVAVVGLAIGVGLYVVTIAVLLLGAALVASLWGVGKGVAIGAGLVLGVAAFVALLWALARLSLIAPASVLDRDFAFERGWRLARGQGWPLLGLMLVIILIVLALEVVLILIAAAGLVAAIGAHAGDWPPAGDNPFPHIHAWLAVNWPWLTLVGLVATWLYGAFLTLSVAPFASACRQLTAAQAASAAPAEAESGSPA
ncbi:MAG: hypothetical protein H2038_01475 [Brevundimonas sp.]|uniref:hypothetical protein n=1 Tax=Brevundimonas sp. TaxID=1871086 RepID=UPI00179F7C7C|nr:hypothetical protein [Brevundimonas sp.]MBA4803301.1 hypothetical protein [Brevundimonas sp.]